MKRIAVLISGRGSHLRNLIQGCGSGEIRADIATVISNNPDAPGLQYADQANIETIVLPHNQSSTREEYDKTIVELLRARRIDLICLAGFMRLLSRMLIDAFPNRIMNVHPALLPAFPGLHAQKQALDHGVKITGVTVHFVDAGLDTGPIIIQRSIDILDNDTEESLSERLLPVEHLAYKEAVQLFVDDRLKVTQRKVTILR